MMPLPFTLMWACISLRAALSADADEYPALVFCVYLAQAL
jgi:hypothetical protein